MGRLCGRCKEGFSESLFSTDCNLNSECINEIWAWVIIAVYGMAYVLFFLFDKEWSAMVKKFVSWMFACCIKKKDDPPETNNNDGGRERKPGAYLTIFMYFVQVPALLQLTITYEKDRDGDLKDVSSSAGNVFNFDSVGMSYNTCILQDVHHVKKVLLKAGFILYLFCVLLVFYGVSVLIRFPCGKKRWNREGCGITRLSIHARFIHAFIVLILYTYEFISENGFLLLKCVEISSIGGDVLFIDGTVTCFQTWQYFVIMFVCIYVFPMFLVIGMAPILLKKDKINLLIFVMAIVFPLFALPYLLYLFIKLHWLKRKLKKLQGDNKKDTHVSKSRGHSNQLPAQYTKSSPHAMGETEIGDTHHKGFAKRRKTTHERFYQRDDWFDHRKKGNERNEAINPHSYMWHGIDSNPQIESQWGKSKDFIWTPSNNETRNERQMVDNPHSYMWQNEYIDEHAEAPHSRRRKKAGYENRHYQRHNPQNLDDKMHENEGRLDIQSEWKAYDRTYRLRQKRNRHRDRISPDLSRRQHRFHEGFGHDGYRTRHDRYDSYKDRHDIDFDKPVKQNDPDGAFNLVMRLVAEPYNLHKVGGLCWEGIIILRRLVLILISTQVKSVMLRHIFLSVACLVIMVVHIRVQPFKKRSSNIMEATSLFIILCIAGMNMVKSVYYDSGEVPMGMADKVLRYYDIGENVLVSILPLCVLALVIMCLAIRLIIFPFELCYKFCTRKNKSTHMPHGYYGQGHFPFNMHSGWLTQRSPSNQLTGYWNNFGQSYSPRHQNQDRLRYRHQTSQNMRSLQEPTRYQPFNYRQHYDFGGLNTTRQSQWGYRYPY